MKKLTIALLIAAACLTGCEKLDKTADQPIVTDAPRSDQDTAPGLVMPPIAIDPVDAAVAELLSQMTLREKVGQMTQLTLETIKASETDGHLVIDPNKLYDAVIKHNVGSILNCGGQARTIENWREIIASIQWVATEKTRLRIPVIYGIDSIHGVNYAIGATVFPQNIAVAATGNVALVEHIGAITAFETRAAGIPWNFNPVLGLARNPYWPRFYETFGEDPYIASQMGAAYVRTQQGDSLADPTKVAACMKHYLGYSAPATGKDRTPAYIPDRQLRQLFLKPFAAAVDAGVVTVMVNSSEINGVPVHASRYLLTDLLRGELGFEGFVVTDWADIENLYTREMVAKDRAEAVRMAVMAGIDMSMVPYDYSFYDTLIELVESGQVPIARIDQAVSRILKVKFQLGLFEKPYCNNSLETGFAADTSTKINLRVATEAITLLKNDGATLPLPKSLKALVTGPTADKLSTLNGGWTITWQGDQEELYPADKLTILEAVRTKCGPDNVAYLPGVDFDKEIDIPAVVTASSAVDVVIACIGEPTYCETPGNIDDLTMTAPQLKLVEQLSTTGKPLVVVMTQGRPRVVSSIVDKTPAILMAYLPGMEGGRAIADVLFGDANPSGKLPFTWPRYPGFHMTYDHKPSEVHGGNKFEPQWPFGFGLSYTSFAYGDPNLSTTEITADQSITVTVDLSNTGKLAGKEIVQLFLRDQVATITPPVKRLVRFTKVDLEPGRTKTVSFTLDRKDLEFIGLDNKPTIEPGKFTLMMADKTAEFELK